MSWGLPTPQTQVRVSSLLTLSQEIPGETMGTVRAFIFLGSTITADGDCSHEIKRCLLLGRKAMTNLDRILEKEMATHSSILAWRIPWMEEPGRLQSMMSHSRTRLSDFTFTFHFHVLEMKIGTYSSVLAWRIPRMGEPGGLLSVGSHRVVHD